MLISLGQDANSSPWQTLDIQNKFFFWYLRAQSPSLASNGPQGLRSQNFVDALEMGLLLYLLCTVEPKVQKEGLL